MASLVTATALPFSAIQAWAQISTPASGTDSPAQSLNNEYILGAGDQIQLNMYGQENFFPTPYRVLIDGTISLPFIGRVMVGGNTISQAQAAIAQRYTQYFKRPYVTVVLTEPPRNQGQYCGGSA